MSLDFFFENRAHQLRRLCTEEPIKYELPRAAARNKLPDELRDFYNLLDRICANSADSNSDAINSESKNSDELRQDVQRFEREIVRLRFSKDAQIKQPAVKLIKAIFADTEYFSGLKPLPQYTDAFAYELLFPSWLNLLTATMLPQAATGKPRLEGQRQGTLFEFLGSVHSAGANCESELIGLLTFVASRYDAPLCEELLQRLADIFSREGGEVVKTIESVERDCKDARQFTRRLLNYLTVKHSLFRWPATSEYPISYKRPAIRVLPDSIAEILTESDQSKDWPKFFTIASRLRHLINSDHLLTKEFMSVLETHPAQTANLLKLVVQGDDPVTFLSPEGQMCLAFLINQESNQESLDDFKRIAAFTDAIAPRLPGYSDSTLVFFCRQFLADASNRKMVYDACESEEMRRQLADYVLGKAGESDDDSRFLEWLACVTVISPDEQSLSAKAALLAIDAVVQNRSIGNREFGDLVTDCRDNVQDCIRYLAAPIMAAKGKSARLASLYMTLNEISETYASTGKVDNFSVVRAKYSRLTDFEME